MTTYNTGNPVGSPAPKDLYDNAENLDTAIHTGEKTWVDRLGNTRTSWAGATGYQILGDYAGGIEITERNQIVREGGEYWRLKGSVDLPYTTTGTWVGDDEDRFVSVGDAALRQELAADGGVFLVKDAVASVANVTELRALTVVQDGQSVYVAEKRRAYIYEAANTDAEFGDTTIVPDGSPATGRWVVAPQTREAFADSGEDDADYTKQGTFLVSSPERYVDGTHAALTPPDGFVWVPPILPVFAAGKWTGNVSARSLIPASDGVEYFVDALAGSDSNDGSASSPLQRVSTALGKPDVGVVTIAPNPPTIAEGAFGNITPTTSANHVIIRPWKQVGRMGRVSSSKALFHRATDWVSSGAAYNRTFKTSVSGVDLVKRIFDFSVRDEDGQPVEYYAAPSVDATEVRPGAWFYDDVAGELHVHAVTGQIPGASVVCAQNGTNLYWNSNKPLYVQGVDFIGGQEPLWFPENGSDVFMLDCGIIGGLGNNLTYYGTGTVVMEECTSMMSIRDGFNYHKSPNSATLPNVVEINCRVISAGAEAGVDSHQCSTMHDGGAILRIGGYYGGAQTQCTGDVSAGTRSWGVGVEYGRSWQTGGNNVSAYISEGNMWMYDCNLGGSDVSVSATSGAVMYLHNTAVRGRYIAGDDIRGYIQK